jgi:hypothetical protein
MEKMVRKFSSFEEAEKADREYYRSLTPEERVAICIELSRRLGTEGDEASERLERVCRVVRLGER